MSGTDTVKTVDEGSNDNVNKDENGAVIVLSVKWIKADETQNTKKLESSLNKMLQTWFNKQNLKVGCSVKKTLSDGRVVVETKPAPGLAELQKLSQQTLTGKDGNSVTITAISITPPSTEADKEVQIKPQKYSDAGSADGEDSGTSSVSAPQTVAVQVQPQKHRDAGSAAGEDSGTSSESKQQTVHKHRDAGSAAGEDSDTSSESKQQTVQIQPKKQSDAGSSAGEDSGTSSVSAPQTEDPQKHSDAGSAAGEDSGTSSESKQQTVAVQVQPRKRSDAGSAAGEDSGTSSVSAPQTVAKHSSAAGEDSGTSSESEPQTGALEQQSSTASAAGEMHSCSVPVGLFWYVNHLYKEELKRIENVNGVKIKAEVKVKFEVEQEDGSPDKALNEFTNVIQTSMTESSSSVIPLKFKGPDQWSDALKTIQKKENKLLVTLTSEEMSACGPKYSQDVIRKFFNADAQKKRKPSASLEEHERETEDTSLKIDMVTKDPLMHTGLTMEKSYWNLMTSSYSERVAKIKEKFNVELKESDVDQDKVNVKAFYKKDGGNASMESHAVRGLVHLYQKIATSHMNFSQSGSTTGTWWPWPWSSV